ncbi:MAG: anhydro-N-acetylmuramic acid kinase [Methylibium sp. NZG]|nr:MAG: anhydro-N-acetylmuramic acid kinase [Methylibium sp. NZG]
MGGLFIGLMSGTSLDGVDGVLCDFDTGASPVHVLAHAHLDFAASFSAELLALNTAGDNELHRAAIAANTLSRVGAQLVADLLAQAGARPDEVRAIGVHGQTVRHRPGEFDATGYTIQINAPALLAELTGVDVVADFRSRDVAAGGQGAPLVPAFHRAVFARDEQTVAVLNVGGIANLTVLAPTGSTLGFDCGPGNALMNHWCHRHTGRAFDDGGAWAASGTVSEALLAALRAEPYFSRTPPKSTGRDLFNPGWLEGILTGLGAVPALPTEDVQATLAELTAQTCAAALRSHAPPCRELLVCGGGSLNTHLMSRLAANLAGVNVLKTDARGLPAMQVEACAFAWLARACCRREHGNVSETTGAAGPRVLGALYPGR